ncbi:MAG: hypothetical protein M1827_004491 [Pycnora praestabilis]|nr:MAG: hypothetical protein M1827_004491 [Pycnora praestabilis]
MDESTTSENDYHAIWTGELSLGVGADISPSETHDDIREESHKHPVPPADVQKYFSTPIGEPTMIGEGQEGLTEVDSHPLSFKKIQTNTSWSPAEKQNLKTMMIAGTGWSEIAKEMYCATFAEGGVISSRDSTLPWFCQKEMPRVSHSFQSQSDFILDDAEVQSNSSIVDTSSSDVYRSARSLISSTPSGIAKPPRAKVLAASYYYDLVEQAGLIVPPDEALHWSDRGQHVEYLPSEEVPLTEVSEIYASLKVKVHHVLSRGGVSLARKTVFLKNRLEYPKLLDEVRHLQKLQHQHVIQLIGTYLHGTCRPGKWFSILLYPVADHDLAYHMSHILPINYSDLYVDFPRRHLTDAFQCLSNALHYIHSQGIKHMDIKPKNILVKGGPTGEWTIPTKFYITDFDIARAVQNSEDSRTNGWTACTRMYCSPEVAADEVSRGRSSDIFSMGCVFLEMMTVIVGKTREHFMEFRAEEDDFFYSNLIRVREWIEIVRRSTKSVNFYNLDNTPVEMDDWLNYIRQMLEEGPASRPTAKELVDHFGSHECCHLGREPYVRTETGE